MSNITDDFGFRFDDNMFDFMVDTWAKTYELSENQAERIRITAKKDINKNDLFQCEWWIQFSESLTNIVTNAAHSWTYSSDLISAAHL